MRRCAEERLRGQSPVAGVPQTEADTAQILHNLRVHEIELEMQNEDLRRAQVELDAVRARYFDLYDLAPVGYVTLSEHSLILEANLTAATLLGVPRGALVKQPFPRFILTEDADIYYRCRKQLFESGEPQACEVRIVPQGGANLWAHLAATARRMTRTRPCAAWCSPTSPATSRRRRGKS